MRILLVVSMCIIAFFLLTNQEYVYDTSDINVAYDDLLPATKRQVDCLAQNIYFEAGHEPKIGQIAVGMVTLNRVNGGQWPSTICGVVREKETNVCQFSWWCESKNKTKAVNRNYSRQERLIYNKAKEVALYVYLNYEDLKQDDITDGAQFYHADYVNPKWKLKKTTKIGRHIFYKQL